MDETDGKWDVSSINYDSSISIKYEHLPQRSTRLGDKLDPPVKFLHRVRTIKLLQQESLKEPRTLCLVLSCLLVSMISQRREINTAFSSTRSSRSNACAAHAMFLAYANAHDARNTVNTVKHAGGSL